MDDLPDPAQAKVEGRTTVASASDVNAAEAAANAITADADLIAQRKAYEQRRSAADKMGAELLHMEIELAKSGLTISDLLRSVAKNFHGVTVPVYKAPDTDAASADAV